MSALPDYSNEFDTIKDYWYFDTLCQDLAKYKATDKVRDLTFHEIQILQGILLGYSPKEIAIFLEKRKKEDKKAKHEVASSKKGKDKNPKKKNHSISVTLSRSINPWVEALVCKRLDQSIDVKGARIPVWLERAGYRKALMCPPLPLDENSRLPDFADDRSESRLPAQSEADRLDVTPSPFLDESHNSAPH
jgi:hypothetical protein